MSTFQLWSPELDGHKRRKECAASNPSSGASARQCGIGSDAETKTTPQGKTVTTFSIATKTFLKKDGDRQERTEWHRVQVWGRMADYAAPFKKGSHICVEGCAASKPSSGAWRSREYESQGAKVRTWPYLIGNRYDIVANSIINLSKGQRNAQTDPAEAAA